MPVSFLKLLLTASLLLLPLVFSERSELLASTEVVEFSDPQLRKRYYQLVQELRCPKCQNQNLADSNAPISKDMKAQIYSMLEAKIPMMKLNNIWSRVILNLFYTVPRSIPILGFYGLHLCV